jgi:hypothetical protein
MTPDSPPDPIRIAIEVGALFDRLGVSYLVAGSLASSAHGEPRSTNHLDDVFVAGTDAFDAERLSQRTRVQLGVDAQSEIWVDVPEYTVLRKLEWYRRGGEVSERQWRDVLGVLRAQGARLNGDRLDGWAERIGVRDLLDRARAEAL